MNVTKQLLLQPRIYGPLRLGLISSFFFPLLSLVLASSLLWLFFSMSDVDIVSRSTLLLGAVLFPSFCFSVFYGFSSIRLILTPEGVAFYSIGYRMYTPWENVERIDQTWHGSRLITGLILREPASVEESISQGIRVQKSVIVVSPWMRALEAGPRTWMIPFENVARDWKSSGLEEDIRRYAPRLLAH